MSLINEALKRTRDAAYQPTHAPAPSYRFDPTAAPSPAKRTGILVLALVVTAAGVAGVYAKRFLGAPPPATASALPVGVSQPPTTVDEEQVVSRVIEKIKAEQQQAVEVTSPAPAPLPVAAPPSRPEPPKLVVQGITRDGKMSEAMINGVTVRAGEQIDGATVTGIEASRVTLSFAGQEIVLRLR
jgi:hypothetical protein